MAAAFKPNGSLKPEPNTQDGREGAASSGAASKPKEDELLIEMREVRKLMAAVVSRLDKLTACCESLRADEMKRWRERCL